MTNSEDSRDQSLPTGRWEGREAFAEHIRLAFAHAVQEGWRLIVLSDPDFADWPLGERSVVAALGEWARSGRELHLLSKDFRALRERAPRFVQWRVTWDHLVRAQSCSGAAADGMPSAIWTPSWMMERLDLVHSTGVATTDARRRTALRERIDQAWQRGSPSFSATTLGL